MTLQNDLTMTPNDRSKPTTYMATWASNNFALSRDFRLINDARFDSTIIPGHGRIFPKTVAAVGFCFSRIILEFRYSAANLSASFLFCSSCKTFN